MPGEEIAIKKSKNGNHFAKNQHRQEQQHQDNAGGCGLVNCSAEIDVPGIQCWRREINNGVH